MVGLLHSRFQPGDVLSDRFTVVRMVARGGMGEVYEVEDRLLEGLRVALKVILPELAADAEADRETDHSLKERLKQEVLLARQTVHPNLCPIYDIFDCRHPEPGFLFLTMRLLPGESLDARLKRQRLLSPDEAASVQAQLVAGLAAVHAAGIVHGDIKPGNVMLDGEGAGLRLWITDFGLARMYAEETTLLSRSRFSGTPGYLAPELFQGYPPSQASDIYALGVLLQEVFTGEQLHGRASGRPVQRRGELRSVPACIAEFLADDPERRCRAFARVSGRALPSAKQTRQIWTRRKVLLSGAGAAALSAGAVLLERKQWGRWLHPLPEKRFVALLIWPPAGSREIGAMLGGVIDAIEAQLSRVEAFDHNFFVMAAPGFREIKDSGQIGEAREALGANLVLAASAMSQDGDMHVGLSVMDPASHAASRTAEFTSKAGEELQLPERAVRAAADLLDVSQHLNAQHAAPSGTQSLEAYSAFQTGEALRKQENDKGLDAAIEAYKSAIELDPRYGLAYAKLALAYGRYFGVHRDAAALALARRNAEAALRLAPELVEGHLAKGMILEQSGDQEAALRTLAYALSLDPGNARLLLEQAQIYDNLDRWEQAEGAFEQIFKQRPNYWQAYNELGAVYSEQGKYPQALNAFRAASLAAPRVAMAFANMAWVQMSLGQLSEAMENCTRSLSLGESALPQATMAAIWRLQRKPDQAVSRALEATRLDPADGTNWLELGDSYAMLREHRADAAHAYAHAAAVQQEQLADVPRDGPGWMVLGLCRAKAQIAGAPEALRTASALPADDLDSQLYKGRALEVLGLHTEAIEVLRRCCQRGATETQLALMADLDALRADPRFRGASRSLPEGHTAS